MATGKLTFRGIRRWLLANGFDEVYVFFQRAEADQPDPNNGRWIPVRTWQPYGVANSRDGVNDSGQAVRFQFDACPSKSGIGEAMVREVCAFPLRLDDPKVWPIRGPQELRRT